ncbi:hypothetical protein F0562_015675 [Nyssa sinensis]|uniref:Uncharacterized protein n=1 Tax=Nyssa sinensis TaxID=561372 RepID=A0A5J4ZM87_9ASTE|nr:hypothetical protein F0562_015675 [Nyssa sinensis]
MVSNAKFEVKKFDGTDNFDMWQCEVLDVLVQQELDITLEDKLDDMEDKDWVKINLQAYGTIRLCLAKDQKKDTIKFDDVSNALMNKEYRKRDLQVHRDLTSEALIVRDKTKDRNYGGQGKSQGVSSDRRIPKKDESSLLSLSSSALSLCCSKSFTENEITENSSVGFNLLNLNCILGSRSQI